MGNTRVTYSVTKKNDRVIEIKTSDTGDSSFIQIPSLLEQASLFDYPIHITTEKKVAFIKDEAEFIDFVTNCL